MKISFLRKIKFRHKNKSTIEVQNSSYKIYKDWSILLITFLILFIIFSGVIFYIYKLYVSEESINNNSSTGDIISVDTENLKNTIKEFENKKDKFEDLLKNKPNVIDPSL